MRKIIPFLCMAFLVASCQNTVAQPKPVISNKYTNTEIDKMTSSYHTNHSQDVVPSEVLSTKLRADFPGAKDIEWETTQNIYEADFEIGNVDYEAFYDAEGNLFLYSYEIREKELPAVVKNAAIAKYPDYIFEDITKICKGTEVMYKIELERHDTDIELLIMDNGTIIKERVDN